MKGYTTNLIQGSYQARVAVMRLYEADPGLLSRYPPDITTWRFPRVLGGAPVNLNN